MISFGSPSFLIVLLALVPAAWAARATIAGLEPPRRQIVLALRGLGIVLLGLALAELQVRDVPERTETVFALDASLSIPVEQQRKALEVIDAARRRLDPRRDGARLVLFGREAVPEATLERDRPLETPRSVVTRGETNLEAALRSALDSFAPDVRRRIVLLSDGVETRGDVRAAVARARLHGTRVSVVPLDHAHENDLLVDRVVTPAEVRAGEPFKVRVVVHAKRRAPARVLLERAGTRLAVRSVQLEAGTNVEVFDVTVPDGGAHRLVARVEAEDRADDRLFQNDEAQALVVATGEPRVLHVVRPDRGDPRPGAGAGSADLAPLGPFAAALRAERLAVSTVAPWQVPQTPAGFAGIDAVVLDDVPRDLFSEAQLRAIEFAVHDGGLGLVMLGGEGSFGAGGWADSPVERALPVDCDVKESSLLPSVALALCLDKSGSMGEATPDGATKIALVREGAGATAKLLGKKDLLGVLAFDSTWSWISPLGPVVDPEKVRRQVHAIDADGGTNMGPALEQVILALEKADAAVKHAIVLTDGLSSPADFPGLVRRCQLSKITLSTIAVGGDADRALLGRMAQDGGGKLYVVERASDLPKVFLREVQRVARPLIIETRFTPARARKSEILGGVAGVPDLHGYVRTEAKPRADLVLVGPKGDPLLAQWQHGAGKAIAFTSDTSARWSRDWVRWEGYQGFFGRALAWVRRDARESGFQLTTRRTGDAGHLVLDALDEAGGAVDGLAPEASIQAPDGERLAARLTQVAPGRYEADFPASETGAYTVLVTPRDPTSGRRFAAVTAGLVVPYSDEFRALETNRPLLESIARDADGRVVEPDEALRPDFPGFFATEERFPEGVQRAQWEKLLAAAAVLFLLDVAVRRVALGGGRRPAPRAAAPGATLERLKVRREAVRDGADPLPSPARSAPSGRAPTAGEPPQPAPPITREPSTASPPPPAPEPTGDSVTDRLLAAKRRAQRDRS